ncbi:MAG: hypothetical protein ACYC1C_03610 [Chloroflexota bacterium]
MDDDGALPLDPSLLNLAARLGNDGHSPGAGSLLVGEGRSAQPPRLGRGRICAIPTYDGSGECTHPSVVDAAATVGGPWHGYRYWMAFTPYPNNRWRFRLENPSIVASHDGIQWVVPVGVKNPLVPPPGLGELVRTIAGGLPGRQLLSFANGTLRRIGYNADPSLYLDRDGTMYLAHVHSLKGEGHDEILLVASRDGWRSHSRLGARAQTWCEPGTYEVNVPSLVGRSRSEVDLYYGYVPADDRGRPRFDLVGIRRRTLRGPRLGDVGPATSLKISLPPGTRLWHHEVRRLPGGELVCLGTFARASGPVYALTWPPTLSLHYGRFTDPDTLVFDDEPLLAPSERGWDSQCIYKPSICGQVGGLAPRWRVWYSAQDAHTGKWRIGVAGQGESQAD